MVYNVWQESLIKYSRGENGTSCQFKEDSNDVRQ